LTFVHRGITLGLLKTPMPEQLPTPVPAVPDQTTDPASAFPPAPLPAPAKEIGGRDGLDPTRYGDWEKNGRCIDF
jgi:hypothetical protein